MSICHGRPCMGDITRLFRNHTSALKFPHLVMSMSIINVRVHHTTSATNVKAGRKPHRHRGVGILSRGRKAFLENVYSLIIVHVCAITLLPSNYLRSKFEDSVLRGQYGEHYMLLTSGILYGMLRVDNRR